jgi:2-oxoglutarate dehydrogenase E2 component (dihydrolipoamide succinyltransferase)
MTIELRVPQVGESITEVMIGDWLKQVGDVVERDEPVVVIETDKVTVELLAPSRGKIQNIILQKGTPAKVNDVVGLLEEVTQAVSRFPVQPAAPVAASVKTAVPAPAQPAPEPPPYRDSMPTENAIPSSHEPPAGHAEGTAADAAPRNEWASPSARRAAREHAPEVADSAQHVPLVAARPVIAAAPAAPAAPAKPLAPAVRAPSGPREEEVVPLTPFRRTIAERLVRSQNEAALLTTFNEADLSTVQELRARYQDAFQKRYDVKLGFMSFFVKAVIEGLKQIPALNAEMRDNAIVYKNYFDIGIAVGGGRGLVVPVLRNAEHLGLAEIERKIADYGKRAKENKLEIDELTGGTFTISNGGVYGSMLSTPIINPPQSGILGLHAIQDRPVARDGQVVIRPMMYIALTYDHRLVDGREAVTFLKLVKEFIEQPARILLEV